MTALTLAAAVGAGLMAGVFYAFSTFVMRALAKLPAAAGIAAMQSINAAVINPLFLGAFLGTALIGGASAGVAVMGMGRPGTGWLLAGGLLYLAGTFGVTLVFNVPLNDALAKVDPARQESAEVWTDYVRRWTAWNHVRTVAAAGALACFVLATRAAG